MQYELLLQDRRVDPSSLDKYGKRPVDLCSVISDNSYQLLKAISTAFEVSRGLSHSFIYKSCSNRKQWSRKKLSCQSDCSSRDKVNISLVKDDTRPSRTKRHNREGDEERERENNYRYKGESKVETLTAGINSYIVKSETIGNMVLYDLAGQSEYYFSQSVIMETIIQKSPAIFINLVDLSKSVEEITQAIHHWLTFIENVQRPKLKNSHALWWLAVILIFLVKNNLIAKTMH